MKALFSKNMLVALVMCAVVVCMTSSGTISWAGTAQPGQSTIASYMRSGPVVESDPMLEYIEETMKLGDRASYKRYDKAYKYLAKVIEALTRDRERIVAMEESIAFVNRRLGLGSASGIPEAIKKMRRVFETKRAQVYPLAIDYSERLYEKKFLFEAYDVLLRLNGLSSEGDARIDSLKERIRIAASGPLHDLRTPLNALCGFSELVYDAYVKSVHDQDQLAAMKSVSVCAQSVLTVFNSISEKRLHLMAGMCGSKEIADLKMDLEELFGYYQVMSFRLPDTLPPEITDPDAMFNLELVRVSLSVFLEMMDQAFEPYLALKGISVARRESPRTNVAAVIMAQRMFFVTQLRDRKIMMDVSEDIEQGLFVALPQKDIVVIFGNIVNNVFDHAVSASKIMITAYQEGSYVVIDIANNGVPIGEDMCQWVTTRDERTVQKLFLPEASSGDMVHNSGLGLYAVDTLCRQAGGSVSAFDRDDGMAVFRLRIPLYQPGKELVRPESEVAMSA